MPFIQLLGEDLDLQYSLAKLLSRKGYQFSHPKNKQKFLEIIPHRPDSLIIIAPSREPDWNVVTIAAEIRSISKIFALTGGRSALRKKAKEEFINVNYPEYKNANFNEFVYSAGDADLKKLLKYLEATNP